MRRLLLVFVSAFALLAHHSMEGTYDRAAQGDYKATVTRVEWRNPHALFVANVSGPDGKLSEWTFELGSPNGLMKEGWTKETLRKGDTLTVHAHPAKDGSRQGLAVRITWPDGTTRENKDAWAPWAPASKE
jgi:hypothetical protein